MENRADRGPQAAPKTSQAQAGVYVSLGSNLGDREAHLRGGLDGLAAAGLRPLACSAIYRTAPVGGPPQGDFLNLVVRVATSVEPGAVLQVARRVEEAAGRVRIERWGPRTLDVDLLLFGDRVVHDLGLEIPHPRLHLRRFVLVPLAELAPAAIHPGLGREIGELLAVCPDTSEVAYHAPPPIPAG